MPLLLEFQAPVAFNEIHRLIDWGCPGPASLLSSESHFTCCEQGSVSSIRSHERGHSTNCLAGWSCSQWAEGRDAGQAGASCTESYSTKSSGRIEEKGVLLFLTKTHTCFMDLESIFGSLP